MLYRYSFVLLALFAFFFAFSFAQGAKFTAEERREGIIEMKSAAEKLSEGMTRAEVVEQIGEPTFETGHGDYYWFAGNEHFRLSYGFIFSSSDKNAKLEFASDTNRFSLLHKRYRAKVADFSMLIDGEKPNTADPIMAVDSRPYISLKDVSTLFGVKFSFDEEMLKQKTKTDDLKIDDSAFITTINFPIFIADRELIISMPIVTVDGNIYLPILDLEAELNINVRMKREDDYVLEIKTNVPYSTDDYEGYYAAIVTSVPVFIDGKEMLTINPIVTIDDNIYLPIEELEEELKIKISHYEKEVTYMYAGGYDRKYNALWLVEINNATKDGYTVHKDYADILRYKRDTSKLRKGMAKNKVDEILGGGYLREDDSLYSIKLAPYRYLHDGGGMMMGHYDNGYKLSSFHNAYDIDILATGHQVIAANFSVLIDDNEPKVKNPFIRLGHCLYAPIADIAEQLKITVSFNDEKGQWEIVTKLF